MWQRQRRAAHDVRAVQDQVEIDHARCVARAAAAAQTRFNRLQSVEQSLGRELRVTGNDHVKEAR